jgi:hypothetical protein
MNKANLKSYAPQARLDFIAAITTRANLLGITAEGGSPVAVRGDVAIIEGREWPSKIIDSRDKLLERIKIHGFEHTMEEVAYTWFNRFSALRFMELHDYIDHGWRVLSSREGGLPEILGHASEVNLSGLSQERARELQLQGNQDNELYKLLLVAQCNELSKSMPFLFERIDDETEILLPENLLRSDSILSKLVSSIPEEDWAEIEVIGWLYQFYISAKKDEVMGKVVANEDIPAATQLFTPNWIVKYLVQNSVGRLWAMANQDSTLSSHLEYYVEPADQNAEVRAKLASMVQVRIGQDGNSLNPESITVLDPACGSGHILVVAYDLLKEIYLERGYQPRAIPRLILEKNLYGLDIDDRAAQLAGFSLLMKARSDDRRLFADPPKMHVLSLQESAGLDFESVSRNLANHGIQRELVAELFCMFEEAKTFGSLIRIPNSLNGQLSSLGRNLQRALESGDLYIQAAAQDLLPMVEQARMLGMKYDAVLANPPYMGAKGMSPTLQAFVRSRYDSAKSDLYACFILRISELVKPEGLSAIVALQNWMFQSSYEGLRQEIAIGSSIQSLLQIGFNSFPSMNSKVALAAAFTRFGTLIPNYNAKFFDCDASSTTADKQVSFERKLEGGEFFIRSQDSFSAIPGSPLSYWVHESVRNAFLSERTLADISPAKQGLSTSDNERFVRVWHEVASSAINYRCRSTEDSKNAIEKWFPYNKGGLARKWYGNNEFIVDWKNDGGVIRSLAPRSVVRNSQYYFKPSITWTDITLDAAFRLQDPSFVFANSAHSAFPNDPEDALVILGILNSNILDVLASAINQSLHFDVGYFNILPWKSGKHADAIKKVVSELVQLHRSDWDEFETSWNFSHLGILDGKRELLSEDFKLWRKVTEERVERVISLERENNSLVIDTYGLNAEDANCEVKKSKISIAVADSEKEMKRLVSYIIGCAMGRYSLDEPHAVYADSANVGFDISRYATFPADEDGILPNTSEPWFGDDVASRIQEFVRSVWGAANFDVNMAWLAENLGAKSNENYDETIRRYLAEKFYKDHLQAYKKRPIYWLFSSGKQGAFQALVYVHRYNESTLARMRSEYVLPLFAKFASRLEILEKDIEASSSSAARTKIQKQIESLRKKQAELLAYDEKLRHYADTRIDIDLDDGVKSNYMKFGDLVAESKAVTGGSDD